MIDRVFDGVRFANVDVQAVEITAWWPRYASLIEALGRSGTEILCKRTLVTDIQIPPYYFTRATHEYVFPPQPRILVGDLSRPAECMAEDIRTIEDKLYGVDEALVKGRIRVRYDDTDSKILFKIEELMESSEIPPDAQFAVGQLKDVTEPFFRD